MEMITPDGSKRSFDVSSGGEIWRYFKGIPNKRCNEMWVAAGGKRTVVLPPGFQS